MDDEQTPTGIHEKPDPHADTPSDEAILQLLHTIAPAVASLHSMVSKHLEEERTYRVLNEQRLSRVEIVAITSVGLGVISFISSLYVLLSIW